jgi:hypothetical protein
MLDLSWTVLPCTEGSVVLRLLGPRAKVWSEAGGSHLIFPSPCLFPFPNSPGHGERLRAFKFFYYLPTRW